MDTNQQFCFTHSSGEDIYLFALDNNNGSKVLISNYGAIVNSFCVKQANGELNDIVLGFDKMEDYSAPAYLQNYPWFGAAIGRYANRIKGAAFKIDGQSYQLSTNNGTDHLHGGINGFDKKVWRLVSLSDNTVELHYLSADGEEGYPGNLSVTIRFELNDNNELSYEYTAVCDQATAINLTHHGYFNLDSTKGSIADHEVKIYSSQYLEQGENFVATGNFVDTKNTAHDFSEWKKIGKDWNPEDGYDQSFVAADKHNNDLSLVAEARSPQSGLTLQVLTTEPVVHFYTGKWIPSIKGKNGDQYGPYSAFCMETQLHPNAVNIPHFPNTILRPGEIYRHKTVCKIIAI
jgi:aldose 1-epimerase